jgi:hypothetical protein
MSVEPEKNADGLDEERITNLAEKILISLRANYQAGPVSRDRVFEALNALAFAAAVVLIGTGDETGEGIEFFQKALDKNLTEYRGRSRWRPKNNI